MVDHVVVLGMACRYPGADTPGELWENVLSRRQAFRPIPAERLPLAEYGGDGPDQTYVPRAAVLEGWTFDRHRFRIPGQTFRSVDLSHWLALETAAAALADAGLPDATGIDRSRVGVVVGNSLTGEFSRAAALRVRWPYVRRVVDAALGDTDVAGVDRAALLDRIEQLYKAPFPAPNDETLAGALANTIAGRICNQFDLHGTGYTVDGACASSLLAVITAAEALTAGQLDVAVTGGVDLSLDPLELVGFARVNALARDEMRVYDAAPTGFLPGEGCGMVVLARESYAREHGLRPYARLLGWASSSDGGGGLTRPEAGGQRLALLRAYQRAGISADQVSLVEGHGTGTAVGDEAELRALLDVRGAGAPPAVIGSVKANIGHTKAAAGVAGLIKATLAVQREVLPPTTGCVDPHPLLSDGSSLRPARQAGPWPTAQRYAGVSAMGFGGINTHVVVGGCTPSGSSRLGVHVRRLTAVAPDHEVVVCAADSPEELAAELVRLRETAYAISRPELTDLAAALAGRHRPTATARFACAVATATELVEALDRALDRIADGDLLDPDRRVFLHSGTPLRVGLLLPGQAAPVYAGGGALGRLLDPDDGRNADVDGPRSGRDDAEPVDTAEAQPAIVRSSLAGLRWLDRLGTHAVAAVGHSLGELSALVWAGALGPADAESLAAARGAAMSDATAVPSTMVGLGADLVTARRLVADTGAVVAADNADRQVVVSGPRDAVEAVAATAAREGVAVTRLAVSHGFHSPLMSAAEAGVRSAARRVSWRPPRRPVASTVTGTWWAAEDPVAVLTRQLTAPVRFREALALVEADLLVEVGPGRMLSTLAETAGRPAVALDAGADSARAVATVTAALFAVGASQRVTPYFDGRFTRPFDLDRKRQFLTNPCERDRTVAPVRHADRPEPPPAAGPPWQPATTPAVTAPHDGGAPLDPLSTVVARVAAAAELPADQIVPAARLLADLHLNSIRVGQLAAELARDLGRALPAAPLTLATATVGELAATVEALPPADRTPDRVDGVGSWVRVFDHHLVPRPAAQTAGTGRWELVGNLAGHPLADRIRQVFATDRPEPLGRLLALPPGLTGIPAEEIVAALRDSHTDRRPLVVLHHGGVGAAVGRSLAVEAPQAAVLVVETPADLDGLRLAALEAGQGFTGYQEVVFGADGVRTTPVTRLLDSMPHDHRDIPLGSGDVCLVTGGAKGIGAYCAAELAAAVGATMVLLGRSPQDDPEVRATVRRTGAAYRQVDLTDRAAVARTVAAVRAEFGPVRGLLHAAGRNEPTTIPELTPAEVRATLAPKADGFEHVVDALPAEELRFAVAFSSVIGRTGLPGETAYAVANEYLSRRCTELAAAVPEVRWLSVEWSVWSGTGMGVRLDALDGLIRRGVAPIPPDEGTRLLLRLLAAPALPPVVLVAGRLPVGPTLAWSGDEELPARFLENRLLRTPAVELVAEASLSLGADPYLADHRVDTVPVLPAVLGLEAMAQATAALGNKTVPGVLSEVTLARPVTVGERDPRLIRTAALTDEDGSVRVVIRSDETGFAVDHLTGRYGGLPGAGRPVGTPTTEVSIAGAPLYGPLFFHGPRFQRVDGYHGLSADRCTARLRALPAQQWFGGFHGQHLELGDPGVRDAALHAVQGCVPDRRVLPVAVARVEIHARAEGQLTLDARQRAQDGDEYVFDLTVTDSSGFPVEQWYGLVLRAVGPLAMPAWPLPLLGPLLVRELRRRHDVTVDLLTAPGDRTDRRRSRDLAAWLADAPVRHDPQGRLRVDGRPERRRLSASHLDGHVVVAAARHPVGVDWALLDDAAQLPTAAEPVTAAVAEAAAEQPQEAAARIWTCREALAKVGEPATAPLTVRGPVGDGWVLLGSGSHALYSRIVDTEAGRVAFALSLDSRPAPAEVS
ncbi:type I polyketide synthase [Micromonospora yangpuensis]|uniref:Enediyne polyketide synthase n=1 Tax=Micromonospora yangpuensis TaxID=683228 RepID=A0A1C6UU14_9ACTN|nr:type I polyketide synthase [Micromonospora yangpuensis]GGM24421.1 polyketide synthase [Micromonospora yangpuensis]SCL57535.1 enediyne polyketide synthase [Micromonospora yangpuensis]